MKCITTIATVAIGIGLSAAALAYPPGVYVGAEVGKSNAHFTPDRAGLTIAAGSNYTTKGTGTRAYVGFQHCQLMGIEFGYSYFASTRFLLDAGDAVVSSHAYDGTLVLSYALKSGVLGQIKAGVANIDLHPDSRTQRSSTLLIKDRSFVRPTYGFGLAYPFNPQISGTLSWKRIQKGSLNPHADLATLGMMFKLDM